MRRRGWILLASAAALVVLTTVVVAAWPTIARWAVVAAVHAATGRPVTVEAVELAPFGGRLNVSGLRVADRDGAPFADFGQLDARVDLGARARPPARPRSSHPRIHGAGRSL